MGGGTLARPGVVVNYPSAATPRLPSVPASAYVIANASTGQVLAAKDAHGQLKPASTLKMLTAVTLLPLLNPNAYVTASPPGGQRDAEHRRADRRVRATRSPACSTRCC